MSAELRLVRWTDRDRQDMRALGRALERLSQSVAISERHSAEPIGRAPAAPPEEPTAVEKARALLRQRRDRAAAFGDHAALFVEPAWDMLLTLFAQAEAMTVAAIIADHPGSGRHWLSALEAEGLTRRSTAAAPMVAITEKGATLMRRYLERV